MSSNDTVKALAKLVGGNTPAESPATENYKTRPEAKQTKAFPSPAATRAISSPLTEQSRVEVEVIVPVPSGATSVSFLVASQITMTDANGTEYIFNYSVPS